MFKLGQFRLANVKIHIIGSSLNSTGINLKIIDYKCNSQASKTNCHMLKAEYFWDSSLHNTFLLNVNTPIAHKILLTLNLIVSNSQAKRDPAIINFFSLKTGHPKNRMSSIYMNDYHTRLFGIQGICKQDLPSSILSAYNNYQRKTLQCEEVVQSYYRLYLNEAAVSYDDESGPNVKMIAVLWKKNGQELPASVS
ncbi:hypothetical protein G6F56_000060 [Rhizopus delemar]|nr:hypothetical protein G6F56_000060 [Rhizopus delemar]